MKKIFTLFALIVAYSYSNAQVSVNSITFSTSSYPPGPSPASGYPITINLDWSSGIALEWIDDITFTLPAGFTPLVTGSTDVDGSNVAVSGQSITFGTPFPGGSNYGPIKTTPTTFTIYLSYPATSTSPITATYSFNGDGYDDNSPTLSMTPTTGTGSVLSNIPMPLKLSNLILTQMPNNDINIAWIAYINTELTRQELEYSSNGIDFEKIVTIENNNSTQNEVPYSYIATNKNASNNFFRIKCFDKSNAISYSNLANIANGIKEFGFTTYNNTIQNDLVFGINSINNTSGNLLIIDATGNIVYQANLQLLKGQNPEKIDASVLANGMYFLNFIAKNKSNSITTKFIKQ